MAWASDFMWEIVQPLDGPSIVREFLDEHGEGVHHVLVDTSDKSFDDTLREAAARGMPPIMEGSWAGTDFAYLQSEHALKTTIEVLRRSPTFRGRPEPDYYYPFSTPQKTPE